MASVRKGSGRGFGARERPSRARSHSLPLPIRTPATQAEAKYGRDSGRDAGRKNPTGDPQQGLCHEDTAVLGQFCG